MTISKKNCQKKWSIIEKPRKKEKIKTKEKPIKKAVSKERLERLQETAKYFEKELAESAEYFKYPKKALVIPSDLDKLIEERKKILAEITAVRNLLESLERERMRLQEEDIRKKTEKTAAELEKFEQSIGEELAQNVEKFKARKSKIIRPKPREIVKKKITAVKPKKEAISEQELAKLQASLDKLNKELESMK